MFGGSSAALKYGCCDRCDSEASVDHNQSDYADDKYSTAWASGRCNRIFCGPGYRLRRASYPGYRGFQLSTPHKWIATATACTTSARAIAGAMFSTINTTAFSARLNRFLPKYVAKAALAAGLPSASVPAFTAALAGGNTTALATVPGVDPVIIGQEVAALKQAYSDSLRIVFIIAVPFGAIAFVACWFLGDLRQTMNYHVDAPVEELHAKELRHDV